MPTLARGLILDMQLPDDFEFGKEISAAIGQNWLKTCHARNNHEVQVSLFFRGTPTRAASAEGFRKLLTAECTLFDSAAGPADDDTTKSILSLEAALGNLANNQLSNKCVGSAGPRFFLEKIQMMNLNGQAVMAVQGYFHGWDGDPQNHYMGIFFDATPEDDQFCRIEEIVFQTPSWDLFERYAPKFQTALNTIRWS